MELGTGISTTRHRQFLAATVEPSLQQTEIHGLVGGSAFNASMTLRGTMFLYDKNLKNQTALPSRLWTPLEGHVPMANGFADSSLYLRGDYGVLPELAPFAAFTWTAYKDLPGNFNPGDTRAYTSGIAGQQGYLGVDLSFQHVNVSWNQNRNFNFFNVTTHLKI